MEEIVHKLVDNTFKNFSFEEAKNIIADKILWYEMKIKQLQEKEVAEEEKEQPKPQTVCYGCCKNEEKDV